MDKFFDLLGDLLRSALNTDSKTKYDPDFQEAWEELDEYLKTGKNREKLQSQYQYEQSWSPPPGFDETLKHAYANLDVPFGVPFEEVKRSYKNLVRKYHPDRFALDPEKQKLATQITQRINESFQKIKKFTKKQH